MSCLPPPTREGLFKETVRLVGGCVAGIVLLGIVVYFVTVVGGAAARIAAGGAPTDTCDSELPSSSC